MVNRGFYGWGHQFLYSREMLAYVLEGSGFEGVTLHGYGESDDSVLRGRERHGDFHISDGCPGVVIAEAARGHSPPAPSGEVLALLEEQFLRFVRAGH